jgi:hypothetical protein
MSGELHTFTEYICIIFLWGMQVIKLKAYTKYLNMFQMKNTAIYMVLRGRRVVEWVRGDVVHQRAELLCDTVVGLILVIFKMKTARVNVDSKHLTKLAIGTCYAT